MNKILKKEHYLPTIPTFSPPLTLKLILCKTGSKSSAYLTSKFSTLILPLYGQAAGGLGSIMARASCGNSENSHTLSTAFKLISNKEYLLIVHMICSEKFIANDSDNPAKPESILFIL